MTHDEEFIPKDLCRDASCDHPNGHVHYESGIEDDGSEWEQLLCDVCNCYLTPADEQEFYKRPDFRYADEG